MPQGTAFGFFQGFAQVGVHVRGILFPETGMLHKFRKCEYADISLAHFNGRHDIRSAQDIGHRSRGGRFYAAYQETDILRAVIRQRVRGKHVVQTVDAGFYRGAVGVHVAHVGFYAETRLMRRVHNCLEYVEVPEPGHLDLVDSQADDFFSYLPGLGRGADEVFYIAGGGYGRVMLVQYGSGQEQPGARQPARFNVRPQGQLRVNGTARVAERRNSRHQRRPGYGSDDRTHPGPEFVRERRRVAFADMVQMPVGFPTIPAGRSCR